MQFQINMKATHIAFLAVTVAMTLLFSPASALTPRLDFNDNHYTYLNAGEVRVCGDHLCHLDEWNYWMRQLMLNQDKNAGPLPEQLLPTGYNANPTSSGKNASDPPSGEITKVTTFNMGGNEFSSFVSISYSGYLDINHIVVSQKSPRVSIFRAWIEPQWNSSINAGTVTFDSKDTNLNHDKVINVVIVTNGKPVFSLDKLSATNPFY